MCAILCVLISALDSGLGRGFSHAGVRTTSQRGNCLKAKKVGVHMEVKVGALVLCRAARGHKQSATHFHLHVYANFFALGGCKITTSVNVGLY